jgi:hypothetical protein
MYRESVLAKVIRTAKACTIVGNITTTLIKRVDSYDRQAIERTEERPFHDAGTAGVLIKNRQIDHFPV